MPNHESSDSFWKAIESAVNLFLVGLFLFALIFYVPDVIDWWEAKECRDAALTIAVYNELDSSELHNYYDLSRLRSAEQTLSECGDLQ